MKTKNVAQAMVLYWKYQHSSTVAELSRRLKVTVGTLYTWQIRGTIPMRHWKKILEVTGFDVRQYVKA